MKHIFTIAIVALFSLTTLAQSKVGTIDVEYIIGNMTTELEQINTALKKYESELSVDLKAKMSDYEAKYKAYEATEATMTAETKKTKQTEIITLENEIGQYRQNGSQLIQLRREELLAPLYQKIGTALDKESKAKGFTHVFTTGSGVLGYIDPQYDLTQSIMNRLGVTVKAANTQN